jgi:hypothetical protein
MNANPQSNSASHPSEANIKSHFFPSFELAYKEAYEQVSPNHEETTFKPSENEEEDLCIENEQIVQFYQDANSYS